ncbi:MAG: hypothetical protein BroJett030_07960 [Alphaproteobacteria bacterium]|nr:MAG: hypothetical protein BroJett030_07960 [Alphaproteobacteria bacterium]
MKRVALAAALIAGLSAAGGARADCTCRYEGGDVLEGQTACIRTSSGARLARCEKFLNNTSWTFLDQPCPTAQLVGPWSTVQR